MVFPQLGYCCVRPAPCTGLPGRIARPAVSPAAATSRWYTTGAPARAAGADQVTEAAVPARTPGRKPGEGELSWASDRSADGLGGPPRFRTSGSVAQEAADRDVETVGLRGRVEPARVELSAQPGELALGQLAGGGDGLVAEARRVAAAVEVLPGLAVADRADRGQVERGRMGLQLRQRPQRAHLVEEAGGEHRVEAAGDAR